MAEAAPDAATERDLRSKLSRAYRQRDEEREAKKGNIRALNKALAERDAALEVIERARAIHYPFHPKGVPDVSLCANNECDAKPWPCDTGAALDGAPEPEWDYGAKVYNSGRVVRIEDSPEKVQLGMSATSYANPQWVDDVLVRRRKAGPWLPVEGESKP